VTAVIRAFRPGDAAALRDITLTAITELGPRGYSAKQVAVWAECHPAAERFVERWESGHLIPVACDAQDTPLAYALLEPDGHLDLLYCHPSHTGKGLAASLLADAETQARGLGLTRLYTEASELARPALKKAGYAVIARRDLALRGVAIHNYEMEKPL
jgi:putative acetyltransferase